MQSQAYLARRAQRRLHASAPLLGGLALATDSDDGRAARPAPHGRDPARERPSSSPGCPTAEHDAAPAAPEQRSTRAPCATAGSLGLTACDGVLGDQPGAAQHRDPAVAGRGDRRPAGAAGLAVRHQHRDGGAAARSPRPAASTTVDDSLRATRIARRLLRALLPIVLVTHDTVGWVTIALVWLGHVTVTGAELFHLGRPVGLPGRALRPRRDAASTRASPSSVSTLGGRSGRRRLYTVPRDGSGAAPGWLIIAGIVVLATPGHAVDGASGRATPAAGARAPACLNPPVATSADWIEGARPRTLPAAVAPVLAGTGVAVVPSTAAVSWKALLAPRRRARAAGRRQLRQRLLRRRARHRRRPGRARCGWSAPAPRRPAGGEGRGVRVLRRSRRSPGWCSRRPPRWWLLAVGAACDRRRRGSTPAARGRTATTASARSWCSCSSASSPSLGTHVRAGRARSPGSPLVGRRRGRRARLRDPRRQQPARHPHRRRSPASARWRCVLGDARTRTSTPPLVAVPAVMTMLLGLHQPPAGCCWRCSSPGRSSRRRDRLARGRPTGAMLVWVIHQIGLGG